MAQNILSNFQSPATGYEIALTEISKSQHSKDEKILKVFEIFDEIIPNLGVYYKIMRIVRQQLFDSVFSNEFTAARADPKNPEPKIQRKSYYLLYKDICDIKDGKNEALKEEIKEKDQILARKEVMLNQFISLNENLKLEVKEANKQMEGFKKDLEKKSTEIYNLGKKMEASESFYKQRIEALENNIEYLSDDLEQRIKQVKELAFYKENFDEIHKAFSPAQSSNSIRKSPKKPVGSNRKNQVLVDIVNAKKFEEQLTALINVSTEEYDDFIEKQQEYLLEKFRKNVNSDSHSTVSRFSEGKPFLTNFEKEILTKQMEAEKINYKKSISDLKNQYDLIVQHRQALEEKLSLIEQDRENSEIMKRQKTKTALQSNSSSIARGLEEHFEPSRKGADKDPYGIQDRVFSKFACTMHYSTNANIWLDFKLVKYCENCGDRTLICPHKLSLDETIIKLPPNTGYLKLTRPKLNINQNLVKRCLDVYTKSNSEYQVGEKTIVLTNYMTHYPELEKDDMNRETVGLLSKGNPSIGMPHDFKRIWKDYETRTEYKRQVQRPFTYERTISVINQFLAYLYNQEMDRNYVPKDIVASLYDFMEQRYENEEIKYAAIYDFFTSIHLYAMKSRFVETFCQVIVGNLDRVIMNYILYVAEITDKIDWQITEDAKIFMGIIYPYCDEDDLENLTLDYISFAENKISKKLVLEYIISLVIKKKDCIINEMEFRLKDKQSEKENYMTEIDFCDVMNEFFFVADERMCQVFYRTALAYAQWEDQHVVSIKKLSHIAAYFCLLQLMNDLKENVSKMIADSRQKILEHDAHFGAQPSKQKSEYEDEFIKVSDIVDMAQTIKRFNYVELPADSDAITEEENNTDQENQETNETQGKSEN